MATNYPFLTLNCYILTIGFSPLFTTEEVIVSSFRPSDKNESSKNEFSSCICTLTLEDDSTLSEIVTLSSLMSFNLSLEAQ